MDFRHPPTCWEEGQLWKVFVQTSDEDKWNIIRQWINIHGNPWVIPNNESEEGYRLRHHYQEALLYTIIKK